jgi:hypothetical protein
MFNKGKASARVKVGRAGKLPLRLTAYRLRQQADFFSHVQFLISLSPK